ncbi:androgen-induced gene 1 protein-like isoform X3 [Anopheles darlingi]|uniref:androgen-induced gene 1 protein-like isoform X3 n=1 Tax=Anopheles darlingi TaxID=43151 RepID=UPI0021000565|nr:androgen-induced gene 1 protein-like isoform X3 [Anopheles darlingi]XP_049548606.1 androgen-induced gene 1 protein-like isoform X3 [Anopheles darlingi]XP_049548607.1 androgen-induced gene 1 protein-like isoform X3 [Anopheles darlingi]XP_049548608.1 androgen-induced gene 1 protein-like isoform X3 [Anopheles darlingi]XP_049548609.1 androgen-induced gene 1 protein-like isoform X3 [Anopheles darlingi]
MSSVQLYKLPAFVITWHLIAFAQYCYAIYFDRFFIHIPDDLAIPKMMTTTEYGGRSKFLTYWCLILQAVYFTICLLNDFIGTNEVAPKRMPLIRKVKDYTLAAFAFPVALNVGVTFWTLMAIDRELVFPKALDAVFPGWLNHVMHTNIVIFMVLEICTSFRQYPSRRAGLTGLGIFMSAYLGWLHVIHHFGGIWVYPVLEVLNMPQRIAFFAVSLAFCVGLYLLGEFFNNLIWTKELKQLKSATSAGGAKTTSSENPTEQQAFMDIV